MKQPQSAGSLLQQGISPKVLLPEHVHQSMALPRQLKWNSMLSQSPGLE